MQFKNDAEQDLEAARKLWDEIYSDDAGVEEAVKKIAAYLAASRMQGEVALPLTTETLESLHDKFTTGPDPETLDTDWNAMAEAINALRSAPALAAKREAVLAAAIEARKASSSPSGYRALEQIYEAVDALLEEKGAGA